VEAAAVLGVPPDLLGRMQNDRPSTFHKTLNRPRAIATRDPVLQFHNYSRWPVDTAAEEHNIAPRRLGR